ncbi:MAG: DUF72 domain-containing protein [Nanopusillaceae archaeon]
MIKVGTCGFPISRKKYFIEFPVVELNNTFYNIPDSEWLKKIRKEAPENFEFTFKAFQGITHDTKSQTWKKANIDYKKLEGKVGFLRPTKEVFEFWEKMMEIKEILNSKIIVIQLPKSFIDNEENIKNAFEFFSSIKKEIKIAIELRGWKKENIKKVCEEFNLIQITDINFEYPALIKETGYYRLHGKYNEKRIIYNYKYSEEELKKIYEKIRELSHKECYVMFNNSYMYNDAKKFLEIINQ